MEYGVVFNPNSLAQLHRSWRMKDAQSSKLMMQSIRRLWMIAWVKVRVRNIWRKLGEHLDEVFRLFCVNRNILQSQTAVFQFVCYKIARAYKNRKYDS